MATVQTDFYRANPLRSMTEYTADLDAQDLRQQQLQQNSLALQGAKLGFEDRNRVMAEQAQIRNALSGLGPGATDEQVFSRIRSLGTPTALAASDAIMKTALERQKAGAAAGKDTEETAAKRVKLYRDQLDLVNSPEQAVQWLTAQHKDPVIGQIMQQMMPLDQALQHLPQDPAQFQQWRQQAALGMEKFITNQTTQRGQDITSQTQLATNAATNARAAADAAAGRAVTMRGQDLTDARTKDNLVKELGKPPPGYVWGPQDEKGTPTLIAAKGGPADLKITGQLNQDTQALTGAVANFDRLAAAANEVLNHPGLSGITGKQGAFPNIPGGQAANAEALLGTLKSQVGFGVLQDLRNNSKTGGALGSVSDAEGKRLEANLAALDKSQSIEQFKTNLGKIIDYSEKAKDRMREAYNLKHGEAKPEKPADKQRPPLGSFNKP